ncbi:alginate export family protein [Bradyrhizobium sp. 48]|uniref:alginate export family protein n=1 Tax=Bradyrhizobium sp. 48 TaxID=2782676 RepID=UPI001FF9E753|nr:alginate export family protein [Bradyrhizobium sp. 48]MCK1446755.1 alginate export family protein [Bradyrhizobium sp. 48]
MTISMPQCPKVKRAIFAARGPAASIFARSEKPLMGTGSLREKESRSPSKWVWIFALSMVSSSALADSICPSPPPYALLRQDEDYSYLRDPGCKRDFLDPIKFISLSPQKDQYLTLGGEVREWYEGFRNANWGVGPQDRDGYLLQRISTYSDWHLGDGIRLFGQLSSATLVGRNGGPRPVDEAQLWLEQAFAQFDVPAFSGADISVRLGRQEFRFGSGRFVDVRDGPNVRRAFDGVSAVLDVGGWHATALVTRPVLNRPSVFDDPSDTGTTFWGLYATKALASMGGGLDLYYLGINNRQATFDRGTGDQQRHTFGARAFGSKGNWDYDWELTYQAGSFAGLPLSAYSFATETGYTFKSIPFAPRVSLKAAATSGDGGPASGTFGTFSALFPTGIYFGQAAIGLNGAPNLLALGATFKANLSDSIQLGIGYDLFWRNSLHDGVYGLAGNLLRTGQESRERYIGDQLSASIVWRATRHVDVSLAYAYFFVGPFLTASAIPGRDVQYGSAYVRFKF